MENVFINTFFSQVYALYIILKISLLNKVNYRVMLLFMQILDLKPQLQQYWVSFNCPSSDGESFWSHEWKKHGTCSGLDQHSYFQAALNLIQTIDILGSLQKAGILRSLFVSLIVATHEFPFVLTILLKSCGGLKKIKN